MSAHKISAEAFEGNIGSVRVFDKNGLTLVETLKVEWVGRGCGRIEGVHVVEWERLRE